MIFSILKYNGVISIPLFAFIFLALLRKIPQFSFAKQTLSQSIVFINKPTLGKLFRLNFALKALLDFGFVLFLYDFFNFSLKTPVTWVLFLAVFLFGSLAYLTIDKHRLLHNIATYGSGLMWNLAEVLLARMTYDNFFIKLTYISVIVTLFIAFGFLFIRKTNIIIQTLCVLIMYVWVVYFIFRFC
jgi:hypothetical protein